MAKTKQEIKKIFDDNFGKFGCSRILAVEQEDFDCGCYAAAMAIDAIVYGLKNNLLSEKLRREKIVKIASSIKNSAIQRKLSLIGEMFDAKNLSEAVNYITEGYLRKLYSDNTLQCKLNVLVEDIESEDELKYYFECSADTGVQILIPYYAGDNDNNPTVESDKIIADGKDMMNAHWAVAKYISKDNIELYEGSCIQEGKEHTIIELFSSNSFLGDIFSWDEFLKENTVEEGLKNKIKKENQNQATNLRGKILLLGLKKS